MWLLVELLLRQRMVTRPEHANCYNFARPRLRLARPRLTGLEAFLATMREG